MLAEASRLELAGQKLEAIAAYERLLESWPGLPDCWFNLAVLQRQFQRYEAALNSYQEALERGVASPEEAYLNRGVIFGDALHRYDAAELEYRKALKCNPDYVPALINYANLYEDVGRRDLAARLYERILNLAPASPHALARYAGLTNFARADDPLIGRLRNALALESHPAADRAVLGFALGRALDTTREYGEAFDVYREANRHGRESAPAGLGDYDPHSTEVYIDRLIAAFPEAGTTVPQSSEGWAVAGVQPIFICGMLRSGSALIEKLLSGHPRITPGGDLDFVAQAVRATFSPFPEHLREVSPDALRKAAADYLALLAERFPHAAFVTDTRPDHFLNIGLIKRLFPAAKIVHSTRDVLDNCLSIYFLPRTQDKGWGFDLLDIGHYFAQYRRLMAHWQTLFGPDIVDVSYDALMIDPQKTLQTLVDLCGVDSNGGWRVAPGIQARATGHARHYEQRLQLLQKYLQTTL